MTARLDDPADLTGAGIDPGELAVCLKVLAQVEHLADDHPDFVAVRLATARIFKAAKEHRRRERRAAILANDAAVTAATATGAPGRRGQPPAGVPGGGSSRRSTTHTRGSSS